MRKPRHVHQIHLLVFMMLQATAFYDNMADRPITASEWREYEIIGDVPAEAQTISYGFALVGDGRAWIDAVSVEVIDK